MLSPVPSLLLLWSVWLGAVAASIYPVESSYWVPPFQRAEKLFATDQGPILARTGNSSVTIDINGVNVTQEMAGWRLVVFFYHVDNYEDFETVAGKIELLACSDVEGMKFDGMSDVQRFVFTVANETTPTTFVRTLARVILLIVCLGYGIVRSHLSRVEVGVITFLSLAYFISGIADEVTRGTSSGADFREKPTAWSFIQLLCNLAFIMWIQFSMERILRDLRDQKQFAKLSMYRWLAWSLAAFIVFFTVLTVVAVCSRLGVFEWDVEWEWMQLVAWPVLNFIVSAAMTLIWRPTQNSSQFAYSMQLPMTESPGIEMTRNTHGSSSDEDINPEIESDSDEEKSSHQEKKQKSYSKDSDDMEGV
ncbi:Phenylalanyl-tRNA synthetase beta chain [Phytophthora nicotianae]|uniref:Phenylalanyl-tRNA synthetase beta chain n=1 Tax=Phytophthora nicotianae TaxID=4792 RepID=A0A0W8DM95_PHYNI|nr:Phenylalanyl-tRNA synthetase beta chain [Phytophthora nicotianae]